MTFLKLIRKLKKESNQLKLVCIGLDNSGKTTILENIFRRNTSNIQPTFGYSLFSCVYRDTTLLVYDIGGQTVFREFWNNYFEKCDGLVFVYDLTTGNDMYLNKIINEVPDIPVLILGNKKDLCNVNKPMVDLKDNVRLYYVSGLDINTLVEPFDWLIQKCKEHLAFDI